MGNEKNNTEYRTSTVLRENDKWVVTVKIKGCEDIMNEYYLYTLDFIYGDRRQEDTRYVGSETEKCRIFLPDEGVKKTYGYICFEQDFGLLYVDDKKTARPITDGLVIEVCEYELSFRKEGPVYQNDGISPNGYVVVDGEGDNEEANIKEFADECRDGVVKKFSKAAWKEYKKRFVEWLKRNF